MSVTVSVSVACPWPWPVSRTIGCMSAPAPIPLSPGLRKLALTAHVSSSIGWFGAVAAFLALAIAGMNSSDAETLRGAYPAMAVATWYILVPASVAALLTGLVSSLGTPWGLFRHYWVVTKLLLTTLSAVVLWVKTPLVDRLASATASGLAGETLARPKMELVVHAAGGLAVLLFATVLGVYKPRGALGDGLPKWLRVSLLVVLAIVIAGALGAHLAAGNRGHISHG